MLDLINRYCHGYVALPVIHALRESGVLQAIEAKQSYILEDIITDFKANSGHLKIAFRLLESLNIISNSPLNDSNSDIVVSKIQPAEKFYWVSEIPPQSLSLIHFPFQKYFAAQLETKTAQKEKKSTQFSEVTGLSGLSEEIKDWLELVHNRWNSKDPMLADFLDGLLLLPLLLTLKEHLAQNPDLSFTDLLQDMQCQQGLKQLFIQRGWLSNVSGSHNKAEVQLTAAGEHLIERIMIGGTVYSYRPMLAGMHELLFGDVKQVFYRDQEGHEAHLDRLLNVQASGFQHERFFKDSREIILEIFNRSPIAEQPDYIADMGCGDGTFLKRIYAVIVNQTIRGKHLTEYPLTLIGADYNQKALDETDKNLADIPHRIVQADIGNPSQFLADLAAIGIENKDKILHVRSFLDHDRPFLAPQNHHQLQQRCRGGKQSGAGRKHSVYADSHGQAIPAVEAYQSLVEHLQRWSQILGESGAVFLEVHSLAPKVIAQYVDQSENLHFDAYHAFSGQILADADEFLFAAAEAGLFPKLDYAGHYPKTFPFSRITLNWFEKRDYTLRPAFENDLQALEQLDKLCWPEHLCAGIERIKARLKSYPTGQFVVQREEQIIGALYTQRVTKESLVEQETYASINQLHVDDGPIVQILGFNVDPQWQHLGLGDQVLDFMLYNLSLSGETEKVIGVSRCKNYIQYASAMTLNEYIEDCRTRGEWDTVLNFHVKHGAEVIKALPDYWAADVDNGGYGILIRYTLRENPQSLAADARTAASVTAESTIAEKVESAVLNILGPKRKQNFQADKALMEMGLDSLDLLELRGLLNQYLGSQLEPMFFFSYGTAQAISEYFQNQNSATVQDEQAGDSFQNESASFRQAYSQEPYPNAYQIADAASGRYHKEGGKSACSLPKQYYQANALEIAIVGISCRFPGGVNSPESLWQLLIEGRDGIETVPRQRWDTERFNDDRYGEEYPINRFGGFLAGIDQFDAEFFGLSPREARLMDPQHRLLLETSWEAFERAAINPEHHLQTGVFVGIYAHDYELLATQRNPDQNLDVYHAVANSASMAAGRLAYFYGFQGPALAIDTACSSSLIAVKQACDSISRGECEMAVAAGVNLMLSPELNVAFSKSGMLAADGHCKTFDAAADGYVRSEGCGVVLLKPVHQALADKDSILGVIKAAVSNQDGASNGITAPNGLAQQALMQSALKQAGLKARDISLLEAHGTGTPLGDPVEIEAVGQVYGEQRDNNNPLTISSVKTNIGHTESAAGIAGLIKLCLCLQYEMIPPHLHFKQANPRLNLQAIPATIPEQKIEWHKVPDSEANPNRKNSRVAAINSFGFSGTNAHLLVEQGPDAFEEPTVRPQIASVLALSAATPEALKQLLTSYQEKFAEDPLPNLLDVCGSVATGRKHFNYRLALGAADSHAMRQKLQLLDTDELDWNDSLVSVSAKASSGLGRAFLFTGQGAQYSGMGKELYYYQPCFRETVDRCDELFKPYLKLSLKELLFSDPNQGQLDTTIEQKLSQTYITQPALFTIEYALARQWQAWGISPDVMIGHSIGEYAAACIAGVFDLNTAVKLVAWRGQLMQAQKANGKMLAVNCDEATLCHHINLSPLSNGGIDSECVIAGYNAPRSLVLSGPAEAIDHAFETLKRADIKAIPLNVSHAFHSPLMQGMLADFQKILNEAELNPPRIKIISTLTGCLVSEEMARPDYWTQQIVKAVNFKAAIQTLAELEYTDGPQIDHLIEIGPRNILLNLSKQILADSSLDDGNRTISDDLLWIPPLDPGISDNLRMAENLAKVYQRGNEIQWEHYFSHLPFKKVVLPTYPFQKKSYWLDDIYPKPDAEQFAAQAIASCQRYSLLGDRIKIPGPASQSEIQFQQHLHLSQQAWLNGHQVQAQILFPLAGYISMALEAIQVSRQQQKGENPGMLGSLTNIIASKPCIVAEQGVLLHTQLNVPAPGSDGQLEIFSLATGNSDSQSEDWQQHFQASTQLISSEKIRTEALANFASIFADVFKQESGYESDKDLENKQDNSPISALQNQLNPIPAAEFYAQCHTHGYEFNGAFQSVKALYQSHEQALIQAELGKEYRQASTFSSLHPATIDAAIQCALLLLPAFQNLDEPAVPAKKASTYLPFSIDYISISETQTDLIWSYAEIRSRSQNGISIDLILFDANEQILGEIRGLLFKPAQIQNVNNQLGQTDLMSLLYRPQWELSELPAVAAEQAIGPFVMTEASAQLLDEEQAFKPIQGSAGELNQLAMAYFCQALRKLGVVDGVSYADKEVFLNGLEIAPQFYSVVNALLQILQQDYHEQGPIGIVSCHGNGFKFKQLNALGDPELMARQLSQKYTDLSLEIQLLSRCGQAFSQVFKGELDPLGLIFGDTELTTQFYRHSPSFKVLNQALGKTVSQLTQRYSRPVKILEIGAGTGSATAFILPQLDGQKYQYTYSDVSEFFLKHGEQHFADYPQLDYQLLDISKDPRQQDILGQQVKQGQGLEGFDIIVAANVLHATADLEQTLKNCRQLLADNGQIVLLEGIQATPWIDSIFGLTEGWWAFNDSLRNDYPLLNLEQWQQALADLDLDYQALALQHADAPFRQAIILANAAAPASVTTTETQPEQPQQKNGWLIFDELNGYAQQLAITVQSESLSLIRIVPESKRTSAQEDKVWLQTYYINPLDPQAYLEILDEIESRYKWDVLVNFWPMAYAQDLTAVQQLEELSQPALYLQQALMHKECFNRRIYHLSQGVQSPSIGCTEQPLAAVAWGMHKVAALEYPQLEQIQVDWQKDCFDAKQLWQEINRYQNSGDAQIAYMNGQRHVARIAALTSSKEQYWSQQQKGTIDALVQFNQADRKGKLAGTVNQVPEYGQVTIQVHYAGLNFIDVMDVLDLLPFEREGLGMECAGIILQCGPGVAHLQPGQEVVALAEGSLADTVRVDARLVVSKPEGIPARQAAGLSVNYLTAYYALFEVAQLQPGQHILIHAAAGGTGMAAVRLALELGAIVYASASPHKWPTLKQMGVSRLVNSRELSFVDQMREHMQAEGIGTYQGIDVVFNSLSGEFIPASISLLKPEGCFLEIGKRDILTPQQLPITHTRINYQAIDLRKISQQQPELIQEIYQRVITIFASPQFVLPPMQYFAWEQVPNAFRYMQQAKHIGKIVLENRHHLTPQQLIHSDAAYLITGGLKGVGLDSACWLAENGAGQLFLLGRSEPGQTEQQIIDTIRDNGTDVEIILADVADYSAMQQAFEQIQRTPKTLRGVIQSVGVLDDGIILKQNWERFNRVLTPKIQGAWNLHQLSLNYELDFFILYSSVVSVLGNAGQANHAAANAYLDALAHYRKANGLVAQSINWCGWSEIGSAAERRVSDKIRQGLGDISPAQGRQVLAMALSCSETQIAVMPMDWSQFLQRAPLASYYSHFVQQVASNSSQTLNSSRTLNPSETLNAEAGRGDANLAKRSTGKISLDPETAIDMAQLILLNRQQQKRQLKEFIAAQLAQVLGMDVAELNSKSQRQQAGFFDLGLDSLTSVEFKNRLNQGLSLKVSSAAIFDHPTLEQMSDHLIELIQLQQDGQSKTSVTHTEQIVGDGGESDELNELSDLSEQNELNQTELTDLEQLSDEEAAALLAKELG